MTVHAGPFYNSHPPVVMLVHGNTRNHEESDLEVKCEMVAQNQTYGLLAAAEEENQLGLHWPCKVDFGSALRAVSSMVWLMTFLGKQQHKITKNHQIQIALKMQDVPSLTFRTARSTRLIAQLMRRAGCHDSN